MKGTNGYSPTHFFFGTQRWENTDRDTRQGRIVFRLTLGKTSGTFTLSGRCALGERKC